MKPRRENGAGLVNPTISDVRAGSALIFLLLKGILRAHSRGIAHIRQITGLRGRREIWSGQGIKKQGRRRSIPSTTLPAPEIKIGLRLPVNRQWPGIEQVSVTQFTNFEEIQKRRPADPHQPCDLAR